MRKKIIGGFAVLAIAAMAAWNVNYGSQTKGMSDLELANVEALAQNEGGENPNCSDGLPRLSCKIWIVSYTGGDPPYTCVTGGTWMCEVGP